MSALQRWICSVASSHCQSFQFEIDQSHLKCSNNYKSLAGNHNANSLSASIWIIFHLIFLAIFGGVYAFVLFLHGTIFMRWFCARDIHIAIVNVECDVFLDFSFTCRRISLFNSSNCSFALGCFFSRSLSSFLSSFFSPPQITCIMVILWITSDLEMFFSFVLNINSFDDCFTFLVSSTGFSFVILVLWYVRLISCPKMLVIANFSDRIPSVIKQNSTTNHKENNRCDFGAKKKEQCADGLYGPRNM